LAVGVRIYGIIKYDDDDDENEGQPCRTVMGN
jgi:hypothetical protein